MKRKKTDKDLEFRVPSLDEFKKMGKYLDISDPANGPTDFPDYLYDVDEKDAKKFSKTLKRAVHRNIPKKK